MSEVYNRDRKSSLTVFQFSYDTGHDILCMTCFLLLIVSLVVTLDFLGRFPVAEVTLLLLLGYRH